MKFLKILGWWALFSVIFWGGACLWIYSLSPAPVTNGWVGISPRGGGEYIVQTYGVWLYIIVSIVLVVVLRIFKKSKTK
jgi:hypothetical protein